MPVSWWMALLLCGAVLVLPELVALSYRVEHSLRLWWINRRLERIARKVYAQLQRETLEMGLEPLPPFSWAALERRYWREADD